VVRKLNIESYELREVLYPGADGDARGVAVVVRGGPFPERALAPEIFVGNQGATLVQVLEGGATIRGIVERPPEPGDELTVRYGRSQEGRIRVEAAEVRPLPEGP
jgi:hypothetical protein